MKIGIVGAAGRMGRWFTEYFVYHGHRVMIYDLRRSEAQTVAKSLKVEYCNTLKELCSRVKVLFVSVPIDQVAEVVEEASDLMNRNSFIVEIASLKNPIYDLMKRLKNRGIRPISIHPLFGSGAKGLEKRKVILVPVSDREDEEVFARKLLPEAQLIVVDVDGHDRAMAVVLALTHLTNAVFSSVIVDEDIGFLRRVSGTTFALQLLLSESVFFEEPTLLSSIQISSRHIQEYFDRFCREADRIRRMIESSDRAGLTEYYVDLRRRLMADREFSEAYQKMYRIFDYLSER